MHVETDLNKIKEMASKKEEENLNFRVFLKEVSINQKEIDVIVQKIHEDVSARIDCTQCANCCKNIRPLLSDRDIDRLAEGKLQPVSDVKQHYLTKPPLQPDQYTFNNIPCPFLRQNLCSCYEYRPLACRSYPHLDKQDIVSRLETVLESYTICPIVYNVYEKLKEYFREKEHDVW
jgi:Fe-S-cluster containining protein